MSDLSGVPLSTLNTYLAGNAEPKITVVLRLAQALETTVSALLAPDSETRKSGNETPETGTQPTEDSAIIPMLDVIASAGPGYENDQPYELQQLPFPRAVLRSLGVKEGSARFLVARGDSMLPTIKDGAVVLVDTSFRRAKDDGIYVLVVGGDVRIKRVAKGWQGAIQLLSDNERYQMEQLAPPEAELLQVAGKVVWAGGEI